MSATETIRERGRAQAQVALSRSGARVAELDARPIPHRVILRVLARAIPRRFDPDAAGELRGVFELRVTDPHGREPARYQLAIADRRCEVTPGPATEPGATATIGADDLIRLASGAVGWPELLSAGRLDLGGDPFLALRFPALFKLPATGAGK